MYDDDNYDDGFDEEALGGGRGCTVCASCSATRGRIGASS